jgi:hypothetical protein
VSAPNRYWLVARDKPALLTHMMRHLAGDAQISFEGVLDSFEFPQSIPRISEERSSLKPCSAYREFPFVILALEPDTVKPILDTILPENRFMEQVIHIQIAKHGEIQFGCYDNFHPDCIVAYTGVSTDFLDELLHRGIIKSWTPAPEEAARPHD